MKTREKRGLGSDYDGFKQGLQPLQGVWAGFCGSLTVEQGENRGNGFASVFGVREEVFQGGAEMCDFAVLCVGAIPVTD